MNFDRKIETGRAMLTITLSVKSAPMWAGGMLERVPKA